jgi:acetylornithine deacetylase
VTASAGALTFRLTVPGRSVHASMRLEGVDAVDKYFLVHSRCAGWRPAATGTPRR